MTHLTGAFSRLGPAKVLVIGDLMLDTYTIGKAHRISPEAPVAVIRVQREEQRPGGSGNVALNLISLGAEVIIVGRVGQDSAAAMLRHVLEQEGVACRGIFAQAGFQTPIKNRIIADNQQIVRVDHEQFTPLPEMLEQQIIEALPAMLEGVKAVAISDYGKGFLSRPLLEALIELAKARGIPTLVDPKGVDFSKYGGADLLKPNLQEAIAAAGLGAEAPLEHIAAKILKAAQVGQLLITRSESGMSLFSTDGSQLDFPVRAHEVKDVTGAGDTVLAMLACCIANQLSTSEAIHMANLAAGIAIEHFGCARVSLSQLARRLLKQDIANKVFDEEHLFALQEALRGNSFALLGVHSSQGLTSRIFSSIRQLGQREGWTLLVYIRDPDPSAEFIDILASLHDVDFIILKKESLSHLCKSIAPDEVYVVERDACRQLNHHMQFSSP